MATWRKSQYQHNRAFCHAIDDGKYPDWAITIRFYVAVHMVTSVLMKLGHSVPTTHRDRGLAISRCAATRPIEASYNLLKGLSEDARYNFQYTHFDDQDVGVADQYLTALSSGL